MTLYRPHRGGLAEAMAEVVTVANRQQLVNHLRAVWRSQVNESGSNVVVEKYGPGIDARIGWDTHIVLVDSVPYGFTDGPITSHDKKGHPEPPPHAVHCGQCRGEALDEQDNYCAACGGLGYVVAEIEPVPVIDGDRQ